MPAAVRLLLGVGGAATTVGLADGLCWPGDEEPEGLATAAGECRGPGRPAGGVADAGGLLAGVVDGDPNGAGTPDDDGLGVGLGPDVVIVMLNSSGPPTGAALIWCVVSAVGEYGGAEPPCGGIGPLS